MTADNDGDPSAPEIESGVYPTDLTCVEQWLTWKPTGAGRKVPRAPYAHPEWPEKFVSAQDPEVWADFETACTWANKLPGYGLAFTIPTRETHSDDPYVLIDYDNARNPATEVIYPTVQEHLARAGSYADVSTSGTGVHIFARGALPDGVKAIAAPLPAAEGFPDAEIEVYDSGRYSAMTGDHIVGTPIETANCQAFIEELAETYATVAEHTPDELTCEPEKTREEIGNVETTDEIQDVFDAIQHVRPGDIHLHSTVTHERADGSKSLDPSWALSKSGTRLAEVGDGWVYRKGLHGLDALQVVALEEGIITAESEYPTGTDFWDGVDALRQRGAHIPEYQPAEADPESVAVLPDTPKARLAMGWDWTHASRLANADLNMTEARGRCQAAIERAFTHSDRVLIEALPTLGKSYGTILAAAATGEPVTVLTDRGRKEQYEQFRTWCDEHGLSHYTLASFTHDCDTANGEHGDEWRETVMDWYHRGATPQEIHKNAEYELGRSLPCQEHGDCPYAAKWKFSPDDYDVLIGHYTHAYKPKATTGRTVVLDEFPGGAYETELDYALPGAVTYFLQCHDALPFEDYADLLAHRNDEQRRTDALGWFQNRDLDTDSTQVFGDRKGHAAAPLAVYTILAGAANDLGNGWERTTFNGGTGLFDRENARVHLLTPPPLTYTRGTVALDGTPTKDLWEIALGTGLNHRPVLTDAERREYVRDVLNHTYIRTTDAIKPYNNADHVNVEQDAALLDKIAEVHGQQPALITTSKAEHEYDTAEDADPLTTMVGHEHYGNVLGSNQFKRTRLGAVIGSNHYGDGYIQKWGAYAGEAVERGEGKGVDLSYGAFGDKVLRHMREHETLQAVMRFGRDGNGATVYVHTNTLPDWVPIAGEGRVLTVWSDGMKQVIQAAGDMGSWRTADLAAHPAVEISQRQVFDHLNTLANRGYLSRELDPADLRGYVWRDDGLCRVNEHGEVELAPVNLDTLTDAEVAEVAGSSIYTWQFRKAPPGSTGSSLVTHLRSDTSDGGPETGALEGTPPAG